jgi:ubiquinone/menaquinone biosynthesis C-methylase UbiE
MNVRSTTRTYVLGHSDLELQRLERQGQIFAEETEATLCRAGLKPGDRVLDVGCGVGDVALAAARMVGPGGFVVGIDRAERALDYARRRAAGSGYDWVRFETGDLNDYHTDSPFDAVTGRFILLYLSDPSTALSNLMRLVRPGGVAAFLELDIEQGGAIPAVPLLTRCIGWITETYRRVGIEPNMGSCLYKTFRAAGLEPEIRGMTRLQGSGETIGLEVFAETIRSLLPRMKELGVVTEAEIGVDTLVQRLREAAGQTDSCIILPRLVGACAEKPE